MKATKFSKQKCYFLTFFCPADDLLYSLCKKAPGQYPTNQHLFLSTWNLYLRETMFVKVTLRDAKEDVAKVCIEVQKTSDKAGGKPTRDFSLQQKTIF